jgi:hypothetical protein
VTSSSDPACTRDNGDSDALSGGGSTGQQTGDSARDTAGDSARDSDTSSAEEEAAICAEVDHYHVLGLRRNFTANELKQAYRKASIRSETPLLRHLYI